jgi:CMP-N,N'-diacetyllegionaminic acid synthase
MGHVLALVPARGGSKGIPDKNIRPLAGHTLLHYAAQAALASGMVDRTVLTTDSDRIAAEGRRAGLEVPFMRPAALALDDTPMLPVVEHAVSALAQSGWEPEIVVLLQPTSPLRTGAHIRAAVEALRATRADSVVTVVELPRHLSPDYVMRIDEGRLVPFLPEGTRITRRQDTRPAFVRDGTAYVFWTKTLRDQRSIYGGHCHPLVVAPNESITIDTPDDWDAAERKVAGATRTA